MGRLLRLSIFAMMAAACGSFAGREREPMEADAEAPAQPATDAAIEDSAPIVEAGGPCPAASGDPSLVAWYPFEETDDDRIRDCSGHALDGKLGAPGDFARVDGRPGQGRAVDLQGACFDLGTAASLKFTGGFTVAAWMKARKFSFADPDASGGRGPIWFASYFSLTDADLGRGWGLGTDDTKAAEFKLFAQDGALFEVEGDTVVGAWVHVAGVYEPGRMKLYLFGGLAQDVPTTIAPGYAADNRGWIGCREQGTPTFDGTLDDVRIYDRALTLAEIQALAQ